MARILRAGDPPPVRILEGLQGVLDTAALAALCRLGVPERLSGPMDIDVLAEARCRSPHVWGGWSATQQPEGGWGWIAADGCGRSQ
jgi:hypothetical protein